MGSVMLIRSTTFLVGGVVVVLSGLLTILGEAVVWDIVGEEKVE